MSIDVGTKTRATIIKVPDVSPGLLIMDGRQASFTLEGRWHSPVAPATNMVVDVVLDGAGGIVAIAAVDAQQLAKERLNQLGGRAQEQGKVAADMARQGVGALAARMGTSTLIAAAAVWVAWFFLPVFSISFLVVSRSFTFWDLLGVNVSNLANPSAGSHGFFSLIGLAAIASPFAAPFLSHPRARFLNALPLAYLVLAIVKFRWDIGRVFESAGGGLFQGMAQSAISEILDSISLGAGAYVLILAAVFLTAKAVRAGR